MICCCESYLPDSGNPYLCGGTFEPSDLVALFREAGIDRALTIPAPEAPLPGWEPTTNRTLKEAMDVHPELLGCCHVDLQRGAAAVDEFEMTVRDWGFKGLKLSTSPSDTVDKLAEAAAGLGVPVTIHTNGSPPTYDRIAGLAANHPGLVIVMEHMGYRYHIDLAVGLAKRLSNVYLGSTVVAAAEPLAVKLAIKEVGAEKMLFGSNAPWAIPRYGVLGIRHLRLGRQDEDLVLGGNFARIYGL